MEEIAIQKAQDDDEKIPTILRTLLLHEEQRETGRRLKYILGKSRIGVTCVEAPTSNGEWTTVTDKVEIEVACQEKNIRRFTQANNTPSLLQPQIELLGWTAQTSIAQNIIQGLDDPRYEQLHKDVRQLIPFLKRPNTIENLGPINTNISTEDYIYAWSRCKEYTSSGISGLHVGHFKASCQNNNLVDTDRRLAEISLTTGYSLK